MEEKLKALAQKIHDDTVDRIKREYQYLNAEKEAEVKIKPGQKYIKVDVRHSGKYMVEVSTGIIYGIKGYGVIHRGHSYGTLDTINDFYWGDYTARRTR